MDEELQQYQLDVCNDITKQMFSVIQTEKTTHGDMFATELVLMVLSSTIATVVNRATNMEKVDHEAFIRIKRALEMTIETGFESGLRAAGKPDQDLDVVCQIHSFDKPYNLLPA